MASVEPRGLTIVGAGELTESSYLPAAGVLGWKTILVDRDLDRAQRLARRRRRIVSGVRSSIEGAELSPESAVVIATPARTHAELAIKAMEAGARQILLEKPPTTTREEYERLAAAADAVGARISTSFIRRSFQSVKSARSEFDSWSARFGTLERVAFVDGSPWGWKSMATRERGAEGLEEITLDELSHGFDSLFHVCGWEAPKAPSVTVDTATTWEFRGSATGVSPDGGPRLDVEISRTRVLANAIVLQFEGATVAVEYTATGGVCVRPRGEPAELSEGPSELDSAAVQFADLLRGAFTPQGGETTPPLSEWKGPVTLISEFRQA